MITLRPASAADEALLLKWANDPATRAAGFRPALITPDEHHLWLSSRLSSEAGRLFIGMSQDGPIGQVRMDRDAEGRVEIGISVAPEARGRGIGKALLDAALQAASRDEDLAARAFIARIRPENPISQALFEGAGFRLLSATEVNGVPCLLYAADVRSSDPPGRRTA